MPTPGEVDLWFHYEEIAMHFNNLIMQYRLQLIGGAGVLGTVASYLIGGKVENVTQRHWLRFIVSSGLLVLITAAASIDVFYYDRLLRGAVDALLQFEKEHPSIQMSTQIEVVVGHGKCAIWFAYGLMLLVLGVFTIWSGIQHKRTRASRRASAPRMTAGRTTRPSAVAGA